jgi:putative heme transporter
LQPLILERAVKLHPLLTVSTVAGGLIVGGLLGAFLSVPVLAIAVEIGSYYRARLSDSSNNAAIAEDYSAGNV